LVSLDERGFGLPTPVKIGACKDTIEEESYLADSNAMRTGRELSVDFFLEAREVCFLFDWL
jgi:hypothetical protein